jgi:hypothetical protein
MASHIKVTGAQGTAIDKDPTNVGTPPTVGWYTPHQPCPAKSSANAIDELFLSTYPVVTTLCKTFRH